VRLPLFHSEPPIALVATLRPGLTANTAARQSPVAAAGMLIVHLT